MEFTTVEDRMFVNSSFPHQSDLINQSERQCLGRKNETELFSGYNLAAKIMLSTLTGIFCLFAFFGNLAVITAIMRDRVISKHKQNQYLLSLAVADALLAVFVVPFSLTNELLGNWPFGEVYCRIYLSLDILLCTASICNICCIGIDRLVSVKYPATYTRFRTTKKIRLAIGFVWVYAVSVSLLPFSGETKLIHERANECFINDSSWFIILSSSLSFFLPAFIIGPVYINIFLIGKRLEESKRARYAASHPEMGEIKLPSAFLRVRCGSRSPSMWRADVIVSPALYSSMEKVQSSPKSLLKHFQKPEDRIVRSVSLSSGQARIPGQSKDDKSKRPSVKSLENQNNFTPSRFLAPPSNLHFQATTQHHLSNGKDARSDLSLIEERQSNSIHSDTVLEDNHPSSGDQFLQKENGQQDTNSNLIYSRSSLCSSTSSNQEGNKKFLSIISSLWRACCAKLKREKNDTKSHTHVIRKSKGVDLNVIRSKARFFSSSSLMSNTRRNSALARRASAMSTQSNALLPSRRERRFIFIISVITGCFLSCWSPFFITYFVYAVCRETCCINPMMFKAFFWVGYLNSAVNPVLYTIFNKDFRLAFKRLFQCSKRNSW